MPDEFNMTSLLMLIERMHQDYTKIFGSWMSGTLSEALWPNCTGAHLIVSKLAYYTDPELKGAFDPV